MADSKLQGGGDRSWLVPFKPDGSGLQHVNGPAGVDIAGNHRGFYAGLDVANPRPGYQYEWVASDPRDVFQARQRGWELVSAEDDDGPAWDLAYDQDSDTPTKLDTSQVFRDVVLARTPDSNFRRLQNANLRNARAKLEMSAGAFLEGASDAERATGRTGQGLRPTRYARREHSTMLTEGDTVLEQWSVQRDLED